MPNEHDGHTHTITAADRSGGGKLLTHSGGCGLWWPAIHSGTETPLVIRQADFASYTLVWDFTVSQSGAISLWNMPAGEAIAGGNAAGIDFVNLHYYIMGVPAPGEANDFTAGTYTGQVNFKEFLDTLGYRGGDFEVGGIRVFVVGDIGASVELRSLHLTSSNVGGTTVVPPPTTRSTTTNVRTNDTGSPIYIILLGIGLLLAVIVVLPKVRKN
jgi:hypothetical protein